MIAASILLASVCAVWLGWRYEVLYRRKLDIASSQIAGEAADRVAMARIEWDAKERIAQTRGTSDVEVAKLKRDAEIEVARIAHPRPVAHQAKASEIQLPDDLDAHVMQWNDEWARDDERGRIRSLYLELHTGDGMETWQKVRRAVGIGELP